jgi:sugar/nucleoside kinase (ribokinase family)
VAVVPELDVAVVGEINLDTILYGLPVELVPERELLASGLALTLGSSSAIFAHNLSSLGTKVGFVSKIGSDPLGRLALERLVDAGVEVHAVKVAVGSMTGLTVILQHPEHRFILTYPGTMFELGYDDIDLDYICSARHFHLSSFFLHRGLRPHMLELFRRVKAAGLTTSLDTNDDPDDQWDRDVLEVLKYVDFFFPNEREAKKLTHSSDLTQARNILAGLAKVVVVKRGPEAALCQAGDKRWSLAPPAVQVIDPVGAGDSFSAGFIHQYMQGANLKDCLAYAHLAGAYSCTREGGTEAFKDRNGMANFFREHRTTSGTPAASAASHSSS